MTHYVHPSGSRGMTVALLIGIGSRMFPSKTKRIPPGMPQDPPDPAPKKKKRYRLKKKLLGKIELRKKRKDAGQPGQSDATEWVGSRAPVDRLGNHPTVPFAECTNTLLLLRGKRVDQLAEGALCLSW